MQIWRSKPWPWLAAALAVVAAVALTVTVTRGGSANAATTTSTDTVTVTGVGTADGAPDTLTVDFTVHTAYASVQRTLNAVAARAHRVLNALHGAGVAEADLRTSQLNLDRRYSHGTPVGYVASETVEARITPLSIAGKAIDAGAHATRHVELGGFSFDIAHDAPLLKQARANAFNDAKSRASQYAGLAGRTLGSVESIREQVQAPQPQPVYYGSVAAAPLRASVPVKGGRQTLTVRVTVIWRLT